MKILHVIRRWKGGVGTYVQEVCTELEKLGHEVKVISREDDLGCFSLRKSFSVLRTAVKKENADVINAHDWSIALPLLGLKNLVVTFHAVEPSLRSRILQRLVYSRAKVIAVSNSVKKKYPKAEVVLEGVNLKLFKPVKGFELDVKKPVIGFAQAKNKLYNYSSVVDAVDTIGGTLLTTGTRDNRSISLGYLERQELSKFYSSLDAFVSLPYKGAGFNLVWLEAMACEIPTVGNYEGVGGELPIVHVKDNKPEKIADAIKKALELKGKTNYREWIRKKGLTWEHTAKKLVEVYERL